MMESNKDINFDPEILHCQINAKSKLSKMALKSSNQNNAEIALFSNEVFNSNILQNQYNFHNDYKIFSDDQNESKRYGISNPNIYWQFINNSLGLNSHLNQISDIQSNFTKKNPFTDEEDKLLISLVNDHGIKNWSKISQGMKKSNFNRNGRQCRDRYYHYLDPNINVNSKWTDEEDYLILKLVENEGKKWKGMEKLFPGRTEVSLRNRYNLLIRKMAKEKRKAEKKIKQTQENDMKKSEISENKMKNANIIVCNSQSKNEDQISFNFKTNTKTNEKLPKIFDDSIFDSIVDETFNFSECNNSFFL